MSYSAEHAQIAAIIKSNGGRVSDSISKLSTHVVSTDPKIVAKSTNHSLPVVDAAWICGVLETFKIAYPRAFPGPPDMQHCSSSNSNGSTGTVQELYLSGVSVFLGPGFDPPLQEFLRKIVREGFVITDLAAAIMWQSQTLA